MAKLQARDAAARAANKVGRDFSEALARGIEIMTVFGAQARSLTLSEVADRVSLPRATVRRALLTLVHLGYAAQEGRQFSLTPRVLHLAGAYLGASNAAAILQPQCELLAAECNETFSVAVLDGDDAVMIAYATPRRMYMDARGIGLRLPAFCSAVGRVLLAGLPSDKRDAYLGRLRPRAVTPFTITNKKELQKILLNVERTGFAIAEAEAEEGFRSLAVPIRRSSGQVAYALNTGMPVERCSSSVMQSRYLTRLKHEAQSLSQQLL